MRVVPNLHFHGNCENAIERYERAFHTRRTVFLRYRDANPDDADGTLTGEKQNWVYLSEMLVSGQRVILNIPARKAQEITPPAVQ